MEFDNNGFKEGSTNDKIYDEVIADYKSKFRVKPTNATVYCGISDVYGGFTDNKLRGSYGHGNEKNGSSTYWNVWDSDGNIEYTGEIPNYSSLKCMTFLRTEGNGGSSCFIDFQDKMIYYGHGSLGIYENIKNSEKAVKITAEMESEILDAIRNANIQDWEYRYKVKTDNPEGNSVWHFGMEFENGSIISFKGINKAPITFFDISKLIYSYMP